MKTILAILFSLSITISSMASERSAMIDSLRKEANKQIYINPTKALELGHEALELCEIADEKLRVLTVLITAYRAVHDYENLVAYGDMAKKISEQEDVQGERVRTYLVLASLYHSIKLYHEGLELLDKAESVLLDSMDEGAADEINFLLGNNYLIKAFIYRDQVGCHAASPFFNKALSQYEALVDGDFANANLSTAHYNYGNCLIAEGLLDEAELHFDQAVLAARKAATPSILSFALKGLGNLYTLQGNFDESLEALRQAENQAEGIGDPMLGQSLYAAMANNHLAMGNWNQFLSYSAQSFELQKKILTNSKSSVLNFLTGNYEKYNEDQAQRNKSYHSAFLLRIGGAVILLLLFIYAFRRMNSSLQSMKLELKTLKEANSRRKARS